MTQTRRRALCAAALALPLLLAAGCGEIASREDFTKAVMNHATAEVEKLYGKPASADAKDPKHVIWTYSNVTYDLQKQNARDPKTRVIFDAGPDGQLKVTSVEFN